MLISQSAPSTLEGVAAVIATLIRIPVLPSDRKELAVHLVSCTLDVDAGTATRFVEEINLSLAEAPVADPYDDPSCGQHADEVCQALSALDEACAEAEMESAAA